MKREERLKDFVVFILCDYEELLNHVISFFNQPYLREDFSSIISTYHPHINEYTAFVNEFIEPIPKIFLEEVSYNDDFQTIGEFLNKEQESELLDYLNTNYNHGYTDEDYFGSNLKLNISSEHLKNYFDAYLKLKNVNNRAYISYFMQALLGIEDMAKVNLKEEVERIEKSKTQFNQLSPALSEEFKNIKRNKYKNSLYKSIENNEVQIQGFIDNYESKDFYISYEETVINQLEILPFDFDDHRWDTEKINYNRSLSHLYLQYLNYSYFGLKTEQSKVSNAEVDAKQKELDKLRKKNSELISFLNLKGFNNEEINILFNLLYRGKFSVINIRYHQFNQKVNQFHIFYCFYILDFYEDQLGDIKSFESLISEISDFPISSAEQFRKYYLHIKSSVDSRHYPFTSIKKTIERIDNTLNINRGRLKKIYNRFF